VTEDSDREGTSVERKGRKARGWGEGGVRRRPDGRWEATLELGLMHGKRKRKSVYGKTKREVLQKLGVARRELEQGLPVADERQSVADYLARWLRESIAPRRAPRTTASYEQMVRCHIVPALGAYRLSKLAPQHVDAMVRGMLQRGSSPRTTLYALAIVRAALNRAVKWELLGRNVATLVDPPRAHRHKASFLTKEQAWALLDALKGDRLAALYILLLSTGLRRGELLGLRWDDLDLEEGVLSAHHAIQRLPGVGWVDREQKTETAQRTIALIPLAVTALRQHRIRQLEERLAAGNTWDDRNLVFPNSVGRPIEGGNLLRRSFAPLLQRAGLPHMKLHELRHSTGSLLLSMDVQMKVVQELLGHSQITLTLDTYAHVLPGMQREALQRLERLLTERGPARAL